jgi:hypothetical protein
MNLYPLTQKYQSLLDLLEDGEAPEEAINDTMSMIVEDIKDESEDCCMVLKQLQADKETLKAEKQRIAAKESAIQRSIDRMRGAMLHAMLLTGLNKIKTPLFSLSTRTYQKLVLDVPEDKIPKEFQKITVKADMKGLEDFMKDNAMLATSFAHFEPADSLIVR